MTYAFRSNAGMSGAPGMPAGWQAGDLLAGYTSTDGNSQTFTTPSGWTRLGTAVNATSECLIARVAQVGDTAPAFTWSGGNVEADIAAFSGTVYTDLTTIVDKYTDRATTSTTLVVMNGGSLVPTSDGSLCFLCGRLRKTSTSDTATFGAAPSTFTKISNANPAGNNQSTIWCYVIQGTKATIALSQVVAMSSPAEGSAQNTQGFGMVLKVGSAVVVPTRSLLGVGT